MDGSKKNKNSSVQKGNVEVVTEKGMLSKDNPSYLTEIENMKSSVEDVQSTNKFIGNMVNVIQDVQTTNKVILQRLGEAMSNLEQECTCKCHTLETTSGKIHRVPDQKMEELKTRLIHLEKNDQIKLERLEHLEEQLKTFVSIVSDLQRNQTSEADCQEEEGSATGEDANETETKSESEAEKDGPDANEAKQDNEASSSANDEPRQEIKNPATDGVKDNQKADESPPVTGDDVTVDSARSHVRVEITNEKVVFVSDEEAEGSDYVSTVHAKREVKVEETKVVESSIKETASGSSRKSADNFTANFTAKPSLTLRETTVTAVSASSGRNMIHQTETQHYLLKEFWQTKAAQEIEAAQRTGLKSLGGIHSVICVDISASMTEGNGWEQTTKFCHDYFNGLAKMAREHDITEEHVALVIFGHKCEVAQRFTNNMNDLIQTFDSLQLGGPSPLYGGFWMSYAAAGSSEKTAAFVNGVHVTTKIIMVTDGRPSDNTMYAGPDVETRQKDETMASIIHLVEVIQNSRVDISYVPVGNANMEFFDNIKAVGECKLLSYKDGLKTSRRLYLTLQLKAEDLFGIVGMQSSISSHIGLSEEDKEMMTEIRLDGQKHMLRDLFTKTDKNKYTESTSDKFPPIGTRVRRGPDWSWHNQDSNGPGTIIGHEEDSSQMWVHWDIDDHMNIYSYGGVKYDVLPVDEPRIIGHRDRLQVGCVVKPGKNWDMSDTRVKSFDRGVVIKLLLDGSKVEVRWEDGHRGDYTYEINGKQEVEYCTPHTTWPSQGGYVLGGESAKRPKNKNKNKNKNNP